MKPDSESKPSLQSAGGSETGSETESQTESQTESRTGIRRPQLVDYARYRWDALRNQHQIVFPEGVLVLNESGAAIVRCCDGRPLDELLGVLQDEFPGSVPAADVRQFLARLKDRGLLRDAPDP